MIRRKELGFTIIELLVVMAIIGILGVLSSAFYSRFLTQNAVANTTDQVVQSIRKAQFYSMMSRKSNASGWGVNWNSGTHELTLYQGSSYASRNSSLDEIFTTNSNISISGLTDLNFSRPAGIPTPSSLAITVSGNDNSKNITLNAVGRVSR